MAGTMILTVIPPGDLTLGAVFRGSALSGSDQLAPAAENLQVSLSLGRLLGSLVTRTDVLLTSAGVRPHVEPLL